MGSTEEVLELGDNKYIRTQVNKYTNTQVHKYISKQEYK